MVPTKNSRFRPTITATTNPLRGSFKIHRRRSRGYVQPPECQPTRREASTFNCRCGSQFNTYADESSSSSGSFKAFYNKLGKDHHRLLGVRNCLGPSFKFRGPFCTNNIFPKGSPFGGKLLHCHLRNSINTSKGASPPSLETPGFVSSVFLVPKKGGGQRPVVNLKPLNQYLPYQHFKMEGIHKVRDLLRKGDFMVKIDLEDAYFTVPVSQEHHNFMRFRWEGTSTSFLASPLVCPLSSGIYKNHETSCRSFTATGHQIDHLFGRLAYYGPVKRNSKLSCFYDSSSDREFRFYDQLSEISYNPGHANGIFWTFSLKPKQ